MAPKISSVVRRMSFLGRFFKVGLHRFEFQLINSKIIPL